MDKRRQVVDNSESGTEVIGGLTIEVPINRNLSQKLFGQLRMIRDEST